MLFNLNPALLRDAACLDQDVVVEAALASHPLRNLFGGAAQRDGELFVVRVEALVAQPLQERESGGVVRAAVVERVLVPFNLVLRLSHCSPPPSACRPGSPCSPGLESS